MKIAFVGKGGSGKTTVSSLFAQYVSRTQSVVAIDADINMHMSDLFRVDVKAETILSEKEPSEEIRTYLRGDNTRIASNAHFKKSTPPGKGSHLIDLTNQGNWFIKKYTYAIAQNLSLGVVGTYTEDGIAASCYHNNLSILENILSHTTDAGSVIVDMVAGTDAFASTLFAQFDAVFFVVEPTMRSLAVYEQYETLAKKGDVFDRLFVVGNKVENQEDEQLIRSRVGNRLIASLSRSEHILNIDKGKEHLNSSHMSEHDQDELEKIRTAVQANVHKAQERLPLLWKLHKTYINQAYVKDRFGDLTQQIDTSFQYPDSETV